MDIRPGGSRNALLRAPCRIWMPWLWLWCVLFWGCCTLELRRRGKVGCDEVDWQMRVRCVNEGLGLVAEPHHSLTS
jgi:hypothetical protein